MKTQELESLCTHADLVSSFDSFQQPLHRKTLKKEDLTQQERSERQCSRRVKGLLPILDWLPKYGKDNQFYQGSAGASKWDGIRRDFICGVVIAVMLVPQGLAYALLAGLPPIYGLYSSTWSIITYAVVGTCKFLGPGVNAPISLLVVSTLSAELGLKTDCSTDANSQDCLDFINASMVLCFMVAVLYVALGLLRLGIVTVLIPEPALSGFTTGASIVIITSHVKYFLGLKLPRLDGVYQTWKVIFEHINETNFSALILGLCAFALLRLLSYVNQREDVKAKLPFPIPEQLVVLLLTTIIAANTSLVEDEGLEVVAEIPSGLYVPKFPEFSQDLVEKLISPAITVAIVTYILTINVGKAMANKYKLNVDANQELYALATTSVVGGLTGSCVPSGSFSRTALIGTLNPESPMHNLWTGIIVAVISLTLTKSLYYLPNATLAAIIFSALKSLLDFRQSVVLWRISKTEWLQWIVSFVGTVVLGVQGGILASIVMSVLLLLKNASHPPTAVLGRLPSGVFVPLKVFPQAKEIPGVKILRFSGSFNFANKELFEKKLKKMEVQDTSEASVHSVIIDIFSVNSIDTTSANMLFKVAQRYASSNRNLLFAGWRGLDQASMKAIEHSGIDQLVLPNRWFLTVEGAVSFATSAGSTQQSNNPADDDITEKSAEEAGTGEAGATRSALGPNHEYTHPPEQHLNLA
mmetsp:Transcript_31373/g.61126  ORF Transcript_31373/g.61126 Transcript_31373/m.61126 type:complete len:696 (-) Transcript_31373:317-2404(-)